jgi:glycosyltransferase involved in cell wall biosynthesis
MYLPRVQRSMVAFNTPAVHGCHGWKLGEYLALGKAIVTTPLLRALPAPLVHGEHAHIVDGSVESLCEAITLLREDRGYRMRLERGARAYFDQYLAPRRVIERLIEAARAAPRGQERPVGA